MGCNATEKVVSISKECARCRKTLPIQMFPISRETKGSTKRCEDCLSKQRVHNKRWRGENPEKSVLSAIRWRNDPRNKDKVREQQERDRDSRSKKGYFRSYLLKKNYNLTEESFRKMVEEQGSACAICDDILTTKAGGYCVDHDHKTGLVRQILCAKCNTGLGQFRDQLKLLANAIRYLKKHGASDE